MATPARGIQNPPPDPSWSDWDARTKAAEMKRAAQEVAAGRTLMVSTGGLPASVSSLVTSSKTILDDPKYKYGLPGEAKGAIYALDPDDHSVGDALYFSRYPTDLNERIEAILAQDTTPGRAYPAFQQLGANGVQLSVELWFCDAFMWSTRSTSVTAYAPIRQDEGAPDAPIDPVAFTMYSKLGTPIGTLAEQARTFFEFYMAGHDGTGIALPPADMFLHWGGSENPIPVVIKSVDMKLECFTTPGGRREQPGGSPQIVTAKVDFEVNVPLRVVNPFKPKVPKPVKKTVKTRVCPSGPGVMPDGRTSNGGSAASFGAFSTFRGQVKHFLGDAVDFVADLHR